MPAGTAMRLVGDTSYGAGCAEPGFPGVYGRLADTTMREWIASIAPDAIATDRFRARARRRSGPGRSRRARPRAPTASAPRVFAFRLGVAGRRFFGLVGLRIGSPGLVVEALRRDRAQAAVPEVDLQVELIAEARDGVDGDQGEAALLDGGLVEDLALELGGRREGAAHQRDAPDQGHLAAAAGVGRQPPITSSFRSIFQSGLSSTVTSVKSALARRSVGSRPRGGRGDVAEVLDRAASGPGRARGGRDVGALAPGALREPADVLRVERGARLVGERRRSGPREPRGAAPPSARAAAAPARCRR